METSEFLSTVDRIHRDAARRGLYFQIATDKPIVDRKIELNGRPLVSFSSCSYLGLEHHPTLRAGVHEAVDRYGTQFSCSRGYLSAPPYRELQERLTRIFDGPVLITSSTSIGHQSTIPVLVTEKDAIILDHQVHYSVQSAAHLAKAGGARVSVVRHNAPQLALDEVRRQAARAGRVWFALDGVFSMYGDLAPIELLTEILNVGENVYLYVDDAHGMSWAGRHGRGSFLSRFPHRERLVLATSLNKAFSAGGGCFVFPNEELRDQVQRCGGPNVFSGPLQPPMLGAAVASAGLHLSSEIDKLQAIFRDRTQLTNRLMGEHGLPLLVENESPIFFVRTGLPRVAFRIAERMMEEGIYLNPSVYPSVPLKRAGIRFSVTSAHSPGDITHAIEGIARHLPAALEEESLSRRELDALFAGSVPAILSACARGNPTFGEQPSPVEEAGVLVHLPAPSPARWSGSLKLEHHRTIDSIDPKEWDRMLGTVGACSHEAMRLAEQVFQDGAQPEYDWTFDYLVVRDGEGRPVAATFFTTMLNKDDMLMRHEVSVAVEERRKSDPYFLTSRILTMGSGFSEGDHLYLDRSANWKEALGLILEQASALYEERQCAMLLLRDLTEGDEPLDAFIHEQGFVRVPMFDSHKLQVDWPDEESWLASLSRRKRVHLRGIIAASTDYSHRVIDPSGHLSEPQIDQLHGMYRAVAERKLRLNVFPLPRRLIPALVDSAAWELVTVHLAQGAGGPADGSPVAWYAAHREAEHYAPFLCGLNYEYVYEHGAYRGMIYQMIQRARTLGCTEVHLGMDADLEKSRFGSVVTPCSAYAQVRDHYNSRLLQEIVAEVGLRRSAG